MTMSKLSLLVFAAMLALASADEMIKAEEKMEDSTVSPIADMAIIDAEMKTSTESPLVMETPKQEEKPPASQRHTVADFIIHPLIAFKPRNPEDDGTVGAVAAAGKQANGASTTTTPSPWQLFGFNAGQGLGSSVTNLAGQFSGWLNDRIQFPGLVETPVRESTSTSTSTTTTPRPDVVVRVQHKASTRAPVISINNRNRPNRPAFDSNEENDDEDDSEDEDEHDNDEEHNSGSDESPDENEGSNEVQDSNEVDESPSKNDDEDDHADDNDEEEEEENHSQRPNNKRRPLRNGSNGNRNRHPQRRRVRPQQQQHSHRRQQPANKPQRRRQRPAAPAVENEVSDEEVQDDDENENNNDNDEVFYHGTSRPSTKRSQNNPNFIQRGQQQLINQIRQLTRGQSPAEIGAAIRKAQRVNNANNNRRRQQATLFVNRNGQTIYYAPELNPMAAPQFQQIYGQPILQKPAMATAFPQPPLTVPLKRKGQPTQYITIPWSQLGIAPPSNIVSITEGVQAQPLILNIPQSAINTMQHQAQHGRPKKKKNRPQLITADAVPLLAEASLMDIFKPPVIPPSRHQPSTMTASKPSLSVVNATPVIVAAKPSSSSTKTSTALFQQHIRPGTIIEKAPDMEETKPAAESVDQAKPSDDSVKVDMLRTGPADKEYILVGQDNEPGITRQVEPVYGDARYVRLTGNSQYYDVLPRRRFTVRRNGRNLDMPDEMPETEQRIPVEILSESLVAQTTMGESEKLSPSESAQSESPAMDAVLSDPRPVKTNESKETAKVEIMAT